MAERRTPRTRNFIKESERAGAYGDAYEAGAGKGVNEAQSDARYAETVVKDGGQVVETAGYIAAVAGTGGAGAGAAGAGGAAGTAGGTAGAASASGAAAGAEATTAGSVAGSNVGVGLEAGTEGANAANAGLAEQSASPANVDALVENSTGDTVSEVDIKSSVEEALDSKSSSGNDVKELVDKYSEISKDGDDFARTAKEKNPLSEKRRAQRRKLAATKNNAAGKDDRGLIERMNDKSTERTGESMNSGIDRLGEGVDIAGDAVGRAIDNGSVVGKKDKEGGARKKLGSIGSDTAGAVNRLGNTTERKFVAKAKFFVKSTAGVAALSILVPIAAISAFLGAGATAAVTSAVAYGGDQCATPSQSNLGMGSLTGSNDPTAGSGGFAWEKLSNTRQSNATQIVKAAAAMDLPAQAAVIALMTAMQESSLENLNYGDAVGPDSRGLFQQRDNWGTTEERMNPFSSATLFYEALVEIDDWESLDLGVAAQRVQISAFPSAYAKHEFDARNVLANVGRQSNPHWDQVSSYSSWFGNVESYLVVEDEEDCETEAAPEVGVWINPYCDGARFAVSGYFGPRGAVAGYTNVNFHNGLDIFTLGSRELCATTSGTVTYAGYMGGCGYSAQVQTADGLTYMYCHMATLPKVARGDVVQTGDPIGIEGSTGNSSGSHLHFEVWGEDGRSHAANPMCLIKNQPDFIEDADFEIHSPKMINPAFDYRCANRNDLGGWR